jgi:hypothetical protein
MMSAKPLLRPQTVDAGGPRTGLQAVRVDQIRKRARYALIPMKRSSQRLARLDAASEPSSVAWLPFDNGGDARALLPHNLEDNALSFYSNAVEALRGLIRVDELIIILP